MTQRVSWQWVWFGKFRIFCSARRTRDYDGPRQAWSLDFRKSFYTTVWLVIRKAIGLISSIIHLCWTLPKDKWQFATPLWPRWQSTSLTFPGFSQGHNDPKSVKPDSKWSWKKEVRNHQDFQMKETHINNIMWIEYQARKYNQPLALEWCLATKTFSTLSGSIPNGVGVVNGQGSVWSAMLLRQGTKQYLAVVECKISRKLEAPKRTRPKGS